MPVTSPFLPTPLDSLQEDSYGVSTFSATPNICVKKGRQLNFAGQTANTSGANVANQAVGTFSLPNGTTSGTSLTAVANTLVGANSLIEIIGINGDPGVQVTFCVVSRVAGTSFTVKVYTSGTTTAAADVHYRITN